MDGVLGILYRAPFTRTAVGHRASTFLPMAFRVTVFAGEFEALGDPRTELTKKLVLLPMPISSVASSTASAIALKPINVTPGIDDATSPAFFAVYGPRWGIAFIFFSRFVTATGSLL